MTENSVDKCIVIKAFHFFFFLKYSNNLTGYLVEPPALGKLRGFKNLEMVCTSKIHLWEIYLNLLSFILCPTCMLWDDQNIRSYWGLDFNKREKSSIDKINILHSFSTTVQRLNLFGLQNRQRIIYYEGFFFFLEYHTYHVQNTESLVNSPPCCMNIVLYNKSNQRKHTPLYIHTCIYILVYIFTLTTGSCDLSYLFHTHIKAIYSYKLGKGNCFELSYTSAWTCKKTFPGKRQHIIYK